MKFMILMTDGAGAWDRLGPAEQAEVFRELDRKRADASCAGGDEHLLAGLELRPLLQRLP
jgi:hypothetical protein